MGLNKRVLLLETIKTTYSSITGKKKKKKKKKILNECNIFDKPDIWISE